MNLYRLKDQNRVINLDHVVNVNYSPAHDGEDEDGKLRKCQSWIELSLAPFHEERSFSFRGLEADALWAHINLRPSKVGQISDLALKKLPNRYKILRFDETVDIIDRVHQAVIIEFEYIGCVRRAEFDVETGEYLGDLLS